MATNYTGNPTATEAPSAAPGGGVYPIVVIPDDGDALNAASVAQGYKVLADFSARQMDQVSSYSFSVSDEFVGNDVAASTWITGVTGTGSALAVVDDNSAGGFGALRHTNGAAGASTYVKTLPLAISTSDFMVSTHVRKSSFATGNSYVVGLNGSSSGSCYAVCYDGGNWNAHVDGSDHDTGVAISASYQHIAIKRTAGVVTFYINGASVYSAAFAVSVSGHWLTSLLDSDPGSSAVVLVDDVKLGVSR